MGKNEKMSLKWRGKYEKIEGVEGKSTGEIGEK